jgi:hypothetical protein
MTTHWLVNRLFLLAPAFRLGLIRRDASGLQAEAQPFEIRDGLLEDLAEDIDVNHRADFGVLVRVGHFARRTVIIVAEVLEMGADLVRHLEVVQTLIQGEEAAVVGGNVQAGVGFIMNCSLSFWKRPSTAPATLPSTSTWRSREKVKVSAEAAGPV